MAIQNFRNDFPLLKNCVYADTAANGLMGQSVYEWRRQHDKAFLNGGTAMKLDHGSIFKQAKRRIALFTGSSPESVSLVQNFSVGFNFILEGLPPSAKVLLLKGEYPSVNWPFESRGFPCVHLPVTNTLEEDIAAVIQRDGVEVFAVSMVQYLDGLLLPVSFFRELKLQFPNLLILVDGTQYCGAFPLDFTNSGIDILGCSGYKWLLGGFGNGFFLFQQDSPSLLELKSTGFNAARGDIRKQHRLGITAKLEPGHLDQLSFGSLNRSIKFLMETGFEKIVAQNRLLSDSAKEGLAELGLLGTIIQARAQHSTIFSIPFSEKTWEALKREKVLCSQRGGGIRFSFHAYNTENEVDLILALLKKLY